MTRYQERNHPFSTAGGPIAFVLREQVSQIFHSGGREGNRLLILGAMESILQDFINL